MLRIKQTHVPFIALFKRIVTINKIVYKFFEMKIRTVCLMHTTLPLYIFILQFRLRIRVFVSSTAKKGVSTTSNRTTRL